MKKKSFYYWSLIFFFFSLSISLIISSCSKTGPEGPAGAQGAPGEQGAPGPEGAKGDAGSANVFYSDWTAFYDGSTWSGAINEYGIIIRKYPVTAPKITDAVIDQGAVMVYVKFASTPSEANPLPVTFASSYNGILAELKFRLSAGSITLIHSLITRPDIDPGAINYQNSYRYIIIPGGVHARRASALPLPDLKDYHAVCKYYGIAE